MKIGKKHYTTIWLKENDPDTVCIIDQRKLPFTFEVAELKTHHDVTVAISDMWVRGAPLIGVAAAYGMYLAALHAPEDDLKPSIRNASQTLLMSRPTAINLKFAVEYCLDKICRQKTRSAVIKQALRCAEFLKKQEIDNCRQIGEFGLEIIKELYEKNGGRPVNILTHCNAGWLACVDYGTATAPMYLAHDAGIPVHIWVDETRPRNQGARLTAWELQQHGVPFTLIADNTGGHLMQHGMVDMVIVGTDRTTRTGDVANKIGTYLKALAAWDNQVPFYVAAPSSSIDFTLTDGVSQIPIEERNSEEVIYMEGVADRGTETFRITVENCKAANFGFDVTPAKYITGIITEKGTCKANEESICALFSDRVKI